MDQMATSTTAMGTMTKGNAVTVKPGETGSFTYTFTTPGSLIIGCHEKGHYAAGMKIVVNVT
jgi:uncharacterized cupredoxin-like copper-binding protein